MQLKRLELLGFKSFANRTSFHFEPGISVLVGPNGSGKSNVADAVRWVLGEQSARALRGKKAEEVIFVGSNGRAPLGMAEVAIVLDNSGRAVPIAYDELRLARRIYRSGESEYLLNGARVRRRDLVDTFLQVGLGSAGYTIIGQGAVEQLVLQRPEERRAVLEHAADITRHQGRLADARGRLDATEQNLLRCDDLIAELEPHARRLRSQAEKAERFTQRRGEFIRLASAYYGSALRQAERAAQEAERLFGEASSACDTLLAEVRRVDATRASQRDGLSTLEADLTARRRSLEQLQRERDLSVARQLEVVRRAAGLQARVDALSSEAVRAGERVAELAAEERDVKMETNPDDRLVSELQRAEQVSEQLKLDLSTARSELDKARARESSLAADQVRLQHQTAELQAAWQRAAREQAEAAARRLELERRAADARGELGQLRAELAVTAQAAQTVAARLSEAERHRQAARQELNQPRDRERSLRAELELARAGLTALDAEMRALDSASSRPALGARLTVPAGYESALGAALGEWATAETFDDRVSAESALFEKGMGRRLAVAPGGRPHADEFVLRVRSLVERAPGQSLTDLLTETDSVVPLPGLLAYTLVARDLEAARRLADALLQLDEPCWQVVTLKGELLVCGGGLVQGMESRAERLIGLRRRREEMREKVQQLEEVTQQATTSLTQAENALAAADAAERAIQLSANSAKSDERTLRRRLDEQVGLVRRLEQNLAHTPQPVDLAMPSAESGLETRHQELQQKLTAASTVVRERGDAIGLLQQAWEQAWLERERLRQRREQGQAEQRAREELRRAQQRERNRAQEDFARLQSELESAQAALAANRQRVQRIEADVVAAGAQAAELSREIDALSQQRSDIFAQVSQYERELSTLRDKLADSQPARDSALLGRERARDELRHLQQEAAQLAEEWGGVDQLNPIIDQGSHPTVAEIDPSTDIAVVRRRIATLQRELRSFGAVSDSVLEEYQEVEGRLRFLRSQAADLRAGTNECLAVIDELESLMRQSFSEVFEQVNQAFGRTFATLFGGGTARLMMTDPDDPLRTGVEIVAQPPGKRLQNLMSLSGGERALTSTALIFALLAINPLPFCVLDEVDAALDESNARRFAALLHEYSRHTQFVIITHNRATMEIAQALYGISMGRDGVTTVLALRPLEALSLARDEQVQDSA